MEDNHENTHAAEQSSDQNPVREDGTYSTGRREPEVIAQPAPGWQPPNQSNYQQPNQNAYRTPDQQGYSSANYYSNQTGQPGPYNQAWQQSPPPYSAKEQRRQQKQARRNERKAPSWAAIIAIAVVAALLGGLAGGLIGYGASRSDISSLRSRMSEQDEAIEKLKLQSAEGSASGGGEINNPEGTLTVAQIAESSSSAVVAIGSKVPRETYFGVIEAVGAGSGVIISADGYIVTNNHVVDGSIETEVTLANGEVYAAEIVGTDATTDLAVIKIEPEEELSYLDWGDSTKMRVGDPVVAIGNPTGMLQGTVTEGVVSALNRTIQINNGDGSSTTMYNVIQTSAAINAGNSGGALLNGRGELIGINSAKPIEVGVEGIAFAIPSETAAPLIEQLKEGQIIRPFIGITGQSVPADNSWGLPVGAMITQIVEGGPADQAGLKVLDIITAVDEREVSSVADISAYITAMQPGDKINLTIVRSGEESEIELTLGETPAEIGSQTSTP